MPRPSRRADLLRAATERFYRDGIATTGLDAVTAEAGTAKMTLSNTFGSKDDLVVTYLQARDERFFDRLDAEIAGRTDPLARAGDRRRVRPLPRRGRGSAAAHSSTPPPSCPRAIPAGAWSASTRPACSTAGPHS